LAYSFGNTGTASDGQHSARRSLGSNPLPSSSSGRYAARSRRFDPISVPTPRTSAPAASKNPNSNASNYDWDEGEEEYAQSPGSVDSLQEAVRRQRNVSDQKRRDDLKGGFKRLRSALPTDRKLSYAELLKYAVQYIMDLIATRDQLKAELETTKDELNAYRLRYANEAQGWARPDAGIVPGSF